MKSPLWIINSALALAALALAAYTALSIKNITQPPRPAPIRGPVRTPLIKRDELKPQESKLIYENDLFGTFKPTIQQPVPETAPRIPPPPTPKQVVPEQAAKVQFLPPLPITVTGIDWSSNELNSRVSIVNNNTKQSALYKTGDKLFDAYILRIFENRILFIRSNGQQEAVYRKPAEAEADLRALQDPSWTGIVQKQTTTRYLIDPTAFISRIASVAAFIDMLDLTSYSKQGVALGCRIGKMEPTSIGFALGFLPGDIITKINNKAPASTTARVEIYNTLIGLSLGSKISVELVRSGTPVTFEYILQALTQPTIVPTLTTLNTPATESAQQKAQIKIPAAPVITQDTLTRLAYENTKVLPVVHKSKRQDKLAMAQFGSKGSLVHHVP